MVERTYDTKVFLSLNQIRVEDHYQNWGSAFSFLANSCSGADDRADLIKTCYTVLNKVMRSCSPSNYLCVFILFQNSPYYTGVDHFLDFHFNALDLSCNRETIMKLRDMVNQLKYEQFYNLALL